MSHGQIGLLSVTGSHATASGEMYITTLFEGENYVKVDSKFLLHNLSHTNPRHID